MESLKSSKEQLYSHIEDMKPELISLSDFIHDNPELGNEEYQAQKRLVSILKKNNFTVEEVEVSETAFVATYKNGENDGPVIGLLCEYDALEGLGHACAHNLQPSTVIGSAIAICKGLQERSYTLKIIGTPAEETTSAKIPMTKAGIFDDLDIALMMHGGDRTTVDGRSLAASNFEFNFHGKESHAAVAPEKGRSALDGVLQTFNGIEYLREHVQSDVRIHGVITNGGKKPNIVPAEATAEFSIRAQNREYLNSVIERVKKVVQGAALSTETTVDIVEKKSLESKLNVQTLNDIILENAHLIQADSITPPRERTGSTDFSIVTHRVPGACIRVSFVPLGTPNHTKDWEKASKSENGYRAIFQGAKILAGTIYDLLMDDSLILKIQEEHLLEKRRIKNM